MFQLNENDQQLLLRIARDAVRSHLAGNPVQIPEVSSDILSEPHGIFVSIHNGQDLRGCIGNIHPDAPLYVCAAECAINAAVRDPRFTPLTMNELADVTFEISVLSRMDLVEDLNQIQVGVHGLLVSKHNAHGLLLPQVASCYGWDRQQFLRETCKKAGLKPDEWKEGLTIRCFSAFVFGETDLHFSAIP